MAARLKQSIRWKYTLIFAGVMAAVVIAIWVLFSVFLKKFYYLNQQNSMETVRAEFEEIWTERKMTESQRTQTVIGMCDKYNMSFLMLASNGSPIYSASSDVSRLTEHLEMFIYSDSETKSNYTEILKEHDDYILWKIYDRTYNSEYLECIGYFLVNGSYRPYIISFPLVAIDESVKLINEFFIYIGLAGILISAVVAFVTTQKIVKPILKLTDISQRMSRLEFDARYNGNEKNEIGILGNNINRLAEKLEQTISELKTANFELQQDNEQQTEIDRMRREFLANVSHELKTPIALIQGYAEGLDEVGDDPESRAYYCNVIMDEANKMNKMVKQLMTLNQIEAHAEKTEVVRFNMTEFILGFLHASEVLYRQKGARIEFDESKDYYVWGDSFQVEEVLTNYFSNALNHLDGERKIGISQEEIPETGQVRITVFNTGKNIPEEDLPKLWDKFYKVDKARTREYGGSGIGLSIVKAILDAHGQSYGVENREGGVAFWFTLEKG